MTDAQAGGATACALVAAAISVLLAPQTATAQQFDLVFETQVNGYVSHLEVVGTNEGDLVVAGSRLYLYWFDPISSTWSEQRQRNGARGPTDLRPLGNSIVATAGLDGLMRFLPDRSAFRQVATQPHNRWLSFSESTGGTWVSLGDQGASLSRDLGQSWSSVDTLFVDQSGPGLVRSLGGGVWVAWAFTGLFEPNFPRLLYSFDDAASWADSTEAATHATEIHEILSTRTHAEIQFRSSTHLARRTWDSAFVEFDSDFGLLDAAYSEVWGPLAVSFEGLYVLDETTLTWTRIGPELALSAVSASPDGTIYIAEVNDRVIWKLVPVTSSASEPIHQERDGVTVFPNPVSQVLRASGAPSDSEFTLFDTLGRALGVYSGADLGLGVDLSRLPPGMYILADRSQDGMSRSPIPFVKRTTRE